MIVPNYPACVHDILQDSYTSGEPGNSRMSEKIITTKKVRENSNFYPKLWENHGIFYLCAITP